MGNNKEVFDAESFAILGALRIFDQRQEGGLIFVDSTAAIERIRIDAIGPGQFLTSAAIEVCFRLAGRDSEIRILWVLAHV